MNVNELFFGSENAGFLGEVFLRTTVMFIVILFSLRILGRKSVKQLSVFELVVIIGLGSAAGDPMFYKEVGLLPAMAVFVAIILLYKITAHFIFKYKSLENLIEGKPVCFIEKGVFNISNFKKEELSQDEFFAELRLKGVLHLGQVELAIIEISGDVSVYFFDKEDTKYGLPILPHSLENARTTIEKQDWYACTFCGKSEFLAPQESHSCSHCQKTKWVPASNRTRTE